MRKRHEQRRLACTQERTLLEWLDDERLFQSRGHAAHIAFHMAAPLVQELVSSLSEAAAALQTGTVQAREVRHASPCTEHQMLSD